MGAVRYIEVQPYPETYGGEKDLTVNAEAAQSTLQDIKLPESAGGYAYQESCSLSTVTSNRYIYWRTSNEILELTEVSLDINLTGSHIRLRFLHTPVLEGVSIHETHDEVIILVATISSVHKLTFPHPRKLVGTDYLSFCPSEATLPSIFFDASLATLQDSANHYVLNHAAAVGVPLPHTSCSWLSSQKDAVFVLANSVGSLLVVCMPQDKEKMVTFELRQTSMMSRIFNGLVPSAIRGNQIGEDMAFSLICHPFNSDTLIFALCKDFRIRMWSYQRQECLMIANVLECCGEGAINMPLNLTAQQFCLKKVTGYGDQEFLLAVYMSLPEQNQFCIFQSRIFSGQYNLSHISTLSAPEYDLVDFHLTDSHLWTLWLNGNSEPVVKFTHIDSEETPSKDTSWSSVALQNPVAREVFTFGHLDPRESYLQEIFKQGRFSTSTIKKAISIYRRIADGSISGDYRSSLHTLKEEVTHAVETEIHSRASESELTSEEFIDLQMECWHKFFSYCLQYHEVGIKPLGLFLDPKSGLVTIIKKNIFTLLRQCDPLEHLILSNANECSPAEFFENPIIAEDASICSSILLILDLIDFVHKHISDDIWADFDHDMFHQHSPELITQDIIRNVLPFTGEKEIAFLQILEKKLPSDMISSLIQSIQMLLKELDLSSTRHVDELLMMEDSMHHPAYNILFSSMFGIGVACEGVRQVAHLRYNFCRELLLFELLMLELGETCGLSLEKAEQMNADIIPHTSMLTQAYFVMKWCTDSYISPVQQNLVESGMQQLTLLDISENPDALSRSKKSSFTSGSLVHLFLREQGGIQARQLLGLLHPTGDRSLSAWNNLLPSMINIITQLILPNGMNFLFPEFLLVHCQYLPLLEYARLLQYWCEWNTCSYQFLVANCHLSLGEPYKALDFFCEAAEGVTQEPFLQNKLMQGIEQQITSSSLIVQYYLKVIQLFEFFKHPECIIMLAETAINIAEPDDSSVPVLWSLIFKHHLELGHNKEAYNAMIINPDTTRRKDSLRQFIVVLCERKELQTLIEFPYVDLKNDVVAILESRARSTDLMTQNYYNLLYAFHICSNNFRRAASTMYEYALRLSRETFGLESLVKQAQCYLATLNCLRLVDDQYAWIVKPVLEVPENKDNLPNESPKRNSDGEIIPYSETTPKMEVMEITDIRQEYDLIHARLQLLQKDPSPSNMAASMLSSIETVALLVNSGLYDAAIHICQAFNHSLSSVFEGIADKCLEMMQNVTQQYANETWDWLGENELTSVQTTHADKFLWYLLKNYLTKYEKPNQSIYHRSVVARLLAGGSQIPVWLKLSYQSRNCPELLWLYISHDMLQEATDLATEYIDAVRGIGKEYFGLKYALHGTNPPVWLPYTLLDMLMLALEENQDDEIYNELCQKLKNKLHQYQCELKSVSETMIEISSKRTS